MRFREVQCFARMDCGNEILPCKQIPMDIMVVENFRISRSQDGFLSIGNHRTTSQSFLSSRPDFATDCCGSTSPYQVVMSAARRSSASSYPATVVVVSHPVNQPTTPPSSLHWCSILFYSNLHIFSLQPQIDIPCLVHFFFQARLYFFLPSFDLYFFAWYVAKSLPFFAAQRFASRFGDTIRRNVRTSAKCLLPRKRLKPG